ncbi:hypothetical protein [Bradyrhizobium sp. BR 1433]|uniref:hypothetical protein n=1 Tax=Bradyrhizobium sp. BR 1433 TaxID=3447967 RepID=UPI003EE6AE99
MLKIVAQERSGCAHVVLREITFQFGPDIAVVPFGRTEIYRLGPEVREVAAFDEAFRFHVSQRDLVMLREDELGVGEPVFQEGAYLTTVAGVDGHQHVIEDSEGKLAASR